MKTFQKIAFILLTAILLLGRPDKVLADSCGGTYGPACETRQILVDKLVRDPGNGNWVDNLGPSSNKFAPEQEVVFKIIVKNTGNQHLDNIKVKDILPSYLSFVSGPSGLSLEGDNRTFQFNVGTLSAGESREYEIKARVAAKKDLPSNQALVCVTNWAQAWNDQTSDTDTAGLCVSYVSILPATGPDTTVLLISILAGLSGLVLLKKTRLN